MESLVSTMWLAEHLEDPDLVVLDCTAFVERTADGSGYRSVSGRKHWEREHIIGSGFADLTV